MIRSEQWSSDRIIKAVGERFVTTRIVSKGCGTAERVRSFPKDVFEVAA